MDDQQLQSLYAWLDDRMGQLADSQGAAHARLREDMNRGFQGVNSRLDGLNGKTSKHDTEIAVLNDRSERAERNAGIVGTATGAGAAGIVLLVKALIGK